VLAELVLALDPGKVPDPCSRILRTSALYIIWQENAALVLVNAKGGGTAGGGWA